MQLNPFSGRYLADPSTVWRHLLDHPDRMVFADDLGMWLIAGHAEVRRALTDTEAFSNALTLAPVRPPHEEAMAVLARLDVPPTTAAADPPKHAVPAGRCGVPKAATKATGWLRGISAATSAGVARLPGPRFRRHGPRHGQARVPHSTVVEISLL
jgi:hypothetical protein